MSGCHPDHRAAAAPAGTATEPTTPPTDWAGSARRAAGARRSGHLPVIDRQRCTGCGRCVAACDLQLLSLEVVRWEKFAVLHEPDRCTGCHRCASSCPFNAVTLCVPAVVAPTDGG